MAIAAIPGRPPPTTFEAIEVEALRHPDRLAVADGTQGWTYREFHQHLVRFSLALHALGVRRGQRVAVARPSFHLQLLLLLASDNLGAVTMPFQSQGDPDLAQVLDLADWVFSELPLDCPPGARLQLLDQGFVDRVMAIDPQAADCPRVALEAHEPQRVSRTSGSSGRSRFMVLSRQAQEHWMRISVDHGGYTADTRLLLQGPLVINAVYARACACLRLGAAVLSLPDGMLATVAYSHVYALPMRLEQLLDALPPGYVAPRTVGVRTGGGFVPPRLRQRAFRTFGSYPSSGYGANETGGICADLDASGTGLLTAGIELRLLDGDGQPVPPGQPGIIAVRTSALVDGYLGDAQATQAAFRDGWFHSGDIGMLVGPRRLRLLGRHDDLLNIGGIKIPAAEVEQRIRALPQVRDCAVLAVNLQGGDATVGVAVVLAPDASQAEVAQAMQGLLALGATTVARILFVAELPRMATSNKLDRQALQRQFQGLVPGPRS